MGQVPGGGLSDKEIRETMEGVIRASGPWSGHNIFLTDTLSTIPGQDPIESLSLRRVVQTLSDIIPRPAEGLRVLDLACLEGLYGIEFALRGATVVGIEGRERNLAKARFAQQALGLRNIEFVCDDVRKLSVERYGRFDVVLCLGILYHLDAPDVFEFVERIESVCTQAAVFHTHVSTSPRIIREFRGRSYAGRSFLEHLPASSQEEREKAVWGSISNPRSFWLTRPSLYNLLYDSGFTSVLESHVPYLPKQMRDHVTLVALKGKRQRIRCVPGLNEIAEPRRPERDNRGVHPGQKWYYPIARRWGRWVPGKAILKRLLGLEWHGRADK